MFEFDGQPALYAATMIFPKSLGNIWRLEENTLNIYMKFGRKYYILYSYENWRKIYLIILMKIGGKVLYIYQDYAENLIEKWNSYEYFYYRLSLIL